MLPKALPLPNAPPLPNVDFGVEVWPKGEAADVLPPNAVLPNVDPVDEVPVADPKAFDVPHGELLAPSAELPPNAGVDPPLPKGLAGFWPPPKAEGAPNAGVELAEEPNADG